MWEFLRGINKQGTTIILTTHYLEEAENLCRHLAIIDHGKVIEHDRMGAVLSRLSHEVFLLNLREPVTAAPDLPGFGVTLLNEHELEVAMPRSRDVNDLFSALSAAGLHVLSLRNKATRLEELFFRMTRRAPAENRPAGAGQP
jgi:ABC-2 type transport system ATP-binding protein